MEIKLMELDRKVFGKITTKEIIGAFPPAIPDTKNLLNNELNNLTKHVNSRPGAMALAQDKIRLFTEYNQKYIQTIKDKLQS